MGQQAQVMGDALLGGDEFLIVLPDLHAPEQAERVAKKVLAASSAPYLLDGYELSVTASIGIALYPMDGTDATGLMRGADAAMYAAKEAGRNTIHFFRAEMNDRAVERLDIESRLRRAVAERRLTLAYQPVVNVATGEMTGVEALLRWNDPVLGWVGPDRFVPIAEETGLIIGIGAWVLREACRQAVMWNTEGGERQSMAVNVSGRQVMAAGFVDTVAEVLDETGLEPQRLELEITERLLIGSGDPAAAVLSELAALGVRLSIDDFGTGYSALSYLKRFPFDVLKIDRAFIDGIATDPESAALSKAIILMAQSLGLEVIAEGVETAAQMAFLQAYGCDLAQGYLYSEPVPAEQITALLRARGDLPLQRKAKEKVDAMSAS